MHPFAKRGLQALNLKQYSELNEPLKCTGTYTLKPPTERQFVLRMLIKRPFENYAIPNELKWTLSVIATATATQKHFLKINQPFCYLTVRHGIVDTITDDEWHVDGFSTTITHLPEQNYIWCSHTPTEYIVKKFDFPDDFNPSLHNIHNFFQDNIGPDDTIHIAEEKTIYALDPYIVHKRPAKTNGQHRTFIRVSFTPIEIMDVNNTFNPLMPTNYTRDGVKNLRDKLVRYEKKIG